MARYSDILTAQDFYQNGQSFTGPPIGGALVLVTYASSGGLAALTDDDGGVADNPIITNADGSYYFNTTPGNYDLTFRYGGRVVGRNSNVAVGFGPEVPFDATRILTGQLPFGLSDEANNGAIPPAGSGLPYLSGGVMKIA